MRNQILVGGALEILPTIPPGTVQCCVTSPPYYGLRDYGAAGEIGKEDSPKQYVENLVAVFREVRRALREDGVLWLNLGDSYANDSKWGGRTSGKHAAGVHNTSVGRGKRHTGLKSKDLIGIPWMVAFALREDGWYLRSDVIWAKGNCMPESVTDRPTKSHEYVFLLTKNQDYFYDQEAIREPISQGSIDRFGDALFEDNRPPGQPTYAFIGGESHCRVNPAGRNKRTVWTVNSKPYKGAHFAVMPEDLATLCIKAGSSEKGCCVTCAAPWRQTSDNTGWSATCACGAAVQPCLVLDPFSGAGTTAVAAVRLGRHYLGVELNPSYIDLSLKRLTPVIEARAQQEAVAIMLNE